MGIIQLFVAEMDRVLLSCVSSERDDTEKYAVSGGSPHDNLWFWVMGMGRVVMTPAMRIERTRRNFTDESNRYDAKRERLVRCARELAERGNAAKVSVTDVTSEMGITRGLFYYYFGGKNELNESIVESYVQDLMINVNGAVTGSVNREEAVHALVYHVHDWLFDEAGNKRPIWHVLDEMHLVDFARGRVAEELADFIIRQNLLAKYGKSDDTALYEHAHFVAMGIIGECRARTAKSIDMVSDAACAALRYRKRRNPSADEGI